MLNFARIRPVLQGSTSGAATSPFIVNASSVIAAPSVAAPSPPAPALNIKGESYRLKEKRRAGMLGQSRAGSDGAKEGGGAAEEKPRADGRDAPDKEQG
jgi:hypothetical protein